ncbi:MAG: dCMP deaminase family protein [Patescibacteria group bacterium]
MAKRNDFISKEDWYMATAMLAAQRSKDPNTQVGACIVNSSGIIIATGYNGLPRGCSDDDFPWSREAENPLDTKYPYVVHAESNAILNKNIASLDLCQLYGTLFPCDGCAKLIIQAGIEEVIYFSDKYHDTNESVASRRMLDAAKVNYRQYQGQLKEIKLIF